MVWHATFVMSLFRLSFYQFEIYVYSYYLIKKKKKKDFCIIQYGGAQLV